MYLVMLSKSCTYKKISHEKGQFQVKYIDYFVLYIFTCKFHFAFCFQKFVSKGCKSKSFTFSHINI